MADQDKAHQTLSMVNGKFSSEITIFDRGLLYGDGLFESMLLQNGKVPLLKYHMERLADGANRLGISYDPSELHKKLDIFIDMASDRKILAGKLRLTLTRAGEGNGSYPPSEGCASSIVLQLSSLSPIAQMPPLELLLARQPLPNCPALAGLKHLNRLPYITATLGFNRKEHQEILFLDDNSNIIETMHHNIFFVKSNMIVSPKLDGCGVAGIVRKILFDQLANSTGMNISEGSISLGQVSSYEECFLTNAVHGLVGVRKLGELEFSRSETCKSLLRAYEDFKLRL